MLACLCKLNGEGVETSDDSKKAGLFQLLGRNVSLVMQEKKCHKSSSRIFQLHCKTVVWVISKLLYIQHILEIFFNKEVNAGNVFRKGFSLLKWKLKLKIPWNKEKSNQIFRGQCEASV
jgi:hypothetical protein